MEVQPRRLIGGADNGHIRGETGHFKGCSGATPAYAPKAGVKVCEYYEAGYCKYESRCRYLHITYQGYSGTTPGRKVCQYNKEGYCRYKNNCWNLHITHQGCKCFKLPGEEGFVRQPLPDRDYDINPLDPDKSSIHVLMDDVLIKILEYLPAKEIILCEKVCRRWQVLVYVIFESSTSLDLYRNDTFDCVFSDMRLTGLSKLLLLKGENLKSLTLGSIHDKNDTLKNKIFFIIAQLCPNLEYLDISNANVFSWGYGRNKIVDVKALKNCKNLTYFSAKNSSLKEKILTELLQVLPCLEKLDVSHSDIAGHCFDLLPEGLKELSIGSCYMVSKRKENLCKISKRCKHLEVLNIENLEADKVFFEELNCTNLRSLKLSTPCFAEVFKKDEAFTKLTKLKIVAHTFELPNIADNLKNLEELHIQMKEQTTNIINFGNFHQLKNLVLICPLRKEELMSLAKCKKLESVTIDSRKNDCQDTIGIKIIDFSMFTHLKDLVLISSPFNKQVLMSVGKCRTLQNVMFKWCKNSNHETVINIAKNCPEIKHIRYYKHKGNIDNDFVAAITEMTKNRSEPLKISLNSGFYPVPFIIALCDAIKIDFYFDGESDYDRFGESSESEEDYENLVSKHSLYRRFWDDLECFCFTPQEMECITNGLLGKIIGVCEITSGSDVGLYFSKDHIMNLEKSEMNNYKHFLELF